MSGRAITENVPLQSETNHNGIELQEGPPFGINNGNNEESTQSLNDDDIETNNNNNNDNIGIALETKFEDPYEDIFKIEMDEDCWCPKCSCSQRCKFDLTLATILAALLGAGAGILIQKIVTKNDANAVLSDEWKKLIAFPGTIWLSALKLLVLPLISLMMVILPSRVANFGRIAKTALPFYVFTSICACIQGSVWVNIIQPGTIYAGEVDIDKDFETSSLADASEMDTILGIFARAVPSNIIEAMSKIQILGVIVFFFCYGLLLRNVNPKDRETVLSFSRALLKCTMVAVTWVVWLTPIGMFSMVCSKIVKTKKFFGLFKALGMYIVTVVVGQGGHLFLVLPIIVLVIARINPYKYFIKIFPAALFAFATSSSAATLPKSIQVAEEANVERSIYSFVLPLGAAINMDGTAQGFPIMIGFISQLYNRDVPFGSQIGVMILSILISIGTAPIPNAGMVYLVMLLEVAGMKDIEAEAMSILLILDWLVDRIETVVNVTSDQYITKMVDKIEKKRNEDTYK